MRVRVHPAFALYLASVCLLSSPSACLALMLALAVHELGHAAAAKMLHEPVERVELAPFGGVMLYAPGRCASKGIRGAAIAAAGPLGNYVLILLAASTWAQRVLPAAFIQKAIACNLAMLLLNLMPALPLDGGGIVFSIGYYLFGIARMTAVLCALGVMLGAAVLLLAVYAAARTGQINLSLLIVGIYLIVCAGKSRSAILTQNAFTVVQERLHASNGCRRLTMYAVPADAAVITLLPWIARAQSAAFLFKTPEGLHMLLDERAACRAMLDNPQTPAWKAAQNFGET